MSRRGVDGIGFRQIRTAPRGVRRCYAVYRCSDDRQIGYVWTYEDLGRWMAGAKPVFEAHEAAWGRGRPAFGSRAEAAAALQAADGRN